jgi:putative ABC transport system permease protein
MLHFMTELRRTARTLTASPGFTIAVLATLVTAVALETTTLSVVNAYLVRSLPYPAADRLYRVTYSTPGERSPRNLEQADWRSASDVVEEQIAWDLDVFYITGGEYPEPAPGEWVTPGFMRGLGVQPAIGRSFRDDDFVPGAPQVALISDELWRRRFAGDSAILGRTFSGYVSDRPQEPSVFTIVGVLPPGFWHVNAYTQILAPLREAATYPYFVRLRKGISPTQAAARISTLIRQTSPGLPSAWQVQLESVHDGYTRSLKPLLTAVAAAVTLVLLIACANVTLLMVLRGMQRRAEIAVRVALGASGRLIARLLIGESLVLCTTAAAGGAIIAAVVLRVLAPLIEQQIGRSAPGGATAIAIDGHVLGALALLAVFMTVATALPPLLVTRTRGVFRGMAARATDGQAASRARSLLVSLQIAGSFGLLVGCALTVRTIRNLVDVRTGMPMDGVVEAGLATRDQTYPTAAARVAFHERLLAALEQAPGVSAAALSSSSPLLSLQPRRVAADDAPGTVARASTRSISTNWLTVLKVPLIDGRAFTSLDRVDAEPVVIISESLARALWPRTRAVGQRLRGYELSMSRRDSSPVVRTVVGVVRDVRQSATDSLTSDMYVPMLQAPTRFASIAAVSSDPVMDWTATLRRAVRSVDPEATVSPAKPLSRSVDEQMRRPRFLASLFTAFGTFAFGVGIIGVYAVAAYGVRQREREIAVRIAVGADRRSVVRMFVQQAGGQLALGLALGCFAAIGVRSVLAAELFGTAALEPLTFAVVGALIGLASSAAVAWPAWRAGGINPTAALRA